MSSHRLPEKYQGWVDARKRFRLSHLHIQMARELGLNPKKFGKLDNIFVERFWRSLKYEEVYLRDYETLPEAREGIARYCSFYNKERPHQSLGYLTPFEVHQDPKRVLEITSS